MYTSKLVQVTKEEQYYHGINILEGQGTYLS